MASERFDNQMDFFKELENLCIANDCCLEYVGEEAPLEYKGFENSWLIFANDAKNDEYDLIILKDTNDHQKFMEEFSSEKNMTQSHKQILSQLRKLVGVQGLN